MKPRHLAASGEVEPPTTLGDRDLIERHVERVIIKPEALEVCLIPPCEGSRLIRGGSLWESRSHRHAIPRGRATRSRPRSLVCPPKPWLGGRLRGDLWLRFGRLSRRYTIKMAEHHIVNTARKRGLPSATR
jgi:hypothetical protein